MKELDKVLFSYLNGLNLPDFFTQLALYALGYESKELSFLFLCIVLAVVVLASPQKGVRAAVALFVVTLGAFFGSSLLKGIFLNQVQPRLDSSLNVFLRVQSSYGASSFPLTSVVTFSAITMVLLYYFPKKSPLFLIAGLVYTAMPVYLGLSYPSIAGGSFLLGVFFSYFVLSLLARQRYFRNY